MSPFKSSAGRSLGKLIEGFKSSDIGKGFGAGGSSGGGGQFEMATVKFYGRDGNLASTSLYTRSSFISGQHFDNVGYYTINFGEFNETFSMRVWTYGGGGGRQSNGPGPGAGGAGGGVTGVIEFDSGDSDTEFTFIVGGGGVGAPSPQPGGFPDGGNATYNAHGGGGSSRFSKNAIPFANRDNTDSIYYLIGGGGGGGIGYTQSGTMDGRAGYPAGQPGGAYYPGDGAIFGHGGSQTGGGSGGPAGRQPAGVGGSKYQGGPSGSTGGGAGGGGYYGGGGGGGYYSMGGGGSGYIHPEVSLSEAMNGNPGSRHQASHPSSYPNAPGFDTSTHSFGYVDTDIAGNGNGKGLVCFKMVV